MEAADGLFGRHRATGPAVAGALLADSDEFQREAVRVAEGEHLLAEAPRRPGEADTAPDQPLDPGSQRGRRDRQRDRRRLPGPWRPGLTRGQGKKVNIVPGVPAPAP